MTQARQAGHPINPLFTNRWSPRAFTGESITQAELLTVLEAARWAPSAYNAQPWRFVYAHRDTASWEPIFNALVPFNQGWVQRAAALVVVISAEKMSQPGKEPTPNAWHSFDTGAAWGSLALQTSLLGLAAHGMAGYDAAALRAAIALPEGYAIEAVIAIGKPGDKSVLPEALQAREVPSDRLPLEQLIADGRFSA